VNEANKGDVQSVEVVMKILKTLATMGGNVSLNQLSKVLLQKYSLPLMPQAGRLHTLHQNHQNNQNNHPQLYPAYWKPARY